MRKEDGKEQSFKFNYKDVVRQKNVAAEHPSETRRHRRRSIAPRHVFSEHYPSFHPRRSSGAASPILCAGRGLRRSSPLLAQTTLSPLYQGHVRHDHRRDGRAEARPHGDGVGSVRRQRQRRPERQPCRIRLPRRSAASSRNLAATANYAWQRRGLQFAATGASTFRYYNDLGEVASVSHTAGVGFSAELARRTHLSVNQTVAYSPSYFYGLFPSVTTPVPGRGATCRAGLQRGRLRVVYLWDDALAVARGQQQGDADRNGRIPIYEFHPRHGVAARSARSTTCVASTSHGMNRNASFRVGYRFSSGNFGYGLPGALSDNTTEQGVDVGVDYTKPLSATRRFVFGFSLGIVVCRCRDALGRRHADCRTAVPGHRRFVAGLSIPSDLAGARVLSERSRVRGDPHPARLRWRCRPVCSRAC